MYHYEVYGVPVESEVELPNAMPLTSPPQEEPVRILCDPLQDLFDKLEPDRLKNEGVHRNENRLLRLSLNNPGCIEEYMTSYGLYRITGGKTVLFRETVDRPICEREQLVLNRLIPMALNQRGRLILHCGAVRTPEGVVAVSGLSGSGKSTLTDELLRHGYPFFSDDTVMVTFGDGQNVYVHAAYPLRRLMEDAVEQGNYRKEDLISIADGSRVKYAVSMKDEFFRSALPLRAFFIIKPETSATAVSAERLRGLDCIKEFSECLYLFWVHQSIGRAETILKECLQFVSRVPVYRLIRPAEGITVEAQRKLVEETLGQLTGAQVL